MRIVQFHEPGQGNRVGVVQGGDVFDVTEIAGEGSLALLLAARSGSVPDVEGAPARGGPRRARRRPRSRPPPPAPAARSAGGVGRRRDLQEERRVSGRGHVDVQGHLRHGLLGAPTGAVL